MAEAAKSWVAAAGHLPESIAHVVGSSHLERAHFEYPTKVWGGGTAMTDVMAFIPGSIVAVEAKERETFDLAVQDWIVQRAQENPASPPHREQVIERYARALRRSSSELLGIRYQLLQRTLSAALTANKEGRPQAWMIVQSFCADHESNSNWSDFNAFRDLVGAAPVLDGVAVRLAWADDACESQLEAGGERPA